MHDNDPWIRQLEVRAAWMSFSGGLTQNEIAARLGVSQAKVHRLIASALKSGIVRIEIAERPRQCLELEDHLTRQFGLRTSTVVPTEGAAQDTAAAIAAIAMTSAHFLANLLAAPDLRQIGVGMGRTLKSAIEVLPKLNRHDLSIVSVSGSLTRRLSANPYDVVQAFQARVGGEGFYLPVPYLAQSREEKDMFHRQKSVMELLARARQSDLFVIGIGSLEDEGHLVANQLISAAERDELRAKGAVGDLMGRFINAGGTSLETEAGAKAVGLHFEEVRGARVLALVAGISKAPATHAALRSGFLTDIVLDEGLARRLQEFGV